MRMPLLSFAGLGIGGKKSFLPTSTAYPDITYQDRMELNIGGLDIELHHAKGETDDHTWAWVPETKTICSGDFFICRIHSKGNIGYQHEAFAVFRVFANSLW